MPGDNSAPIGALLARAKAAHGVYEATELDGVYDEAWPNWYAKFLLDQGIGSLLSRDVTVDELASFLATSWQEAQQSNPQPSEPWSEYTARRIASEL